MTDTIGAVLARSLRAMGVTGLYGPDLPGVPLGGHGIGPVSADTARVLALAHRHVLRADAAVHLGDGRIELGPAAPGRVDPSPSEIVSEVADVAAVMTELGRTTSPGKHGMAVTIILDVDPTTPIAEGSEPAPIGPVDSWVEPPGTAHQRLATARHAVILAGPGVPRAGAVPGLHALAAAGSLGVLNTFGAKGVFDWRSRHHLATVGLQARDLELGGLAEADLVVTTGLDPAETPPLPADCTIVELEPGALGPLAEKHGVPRRAIPVPPLRPKLARVTQEGWQAATAPLPPSLLTRTYSTVTASRGFVAADPGVAGYWLARTFPTSVLGQAEVPAETWANGFAVACALLGVLTDPGGPILAVTDAPLGAVTHELLDVANRLGVPLALEVWGDDGQCLDRDAHRERLRLLIRTGGTASITTDPSQMARMEDVAGPRTAWREVVP